MCMQDGFTSLALSTMAATSAAETCTSRVTCHNVTCGTMPYLNLAKAAAINVLRDAFSPVAQLPLIRL
jgi:hypothetical protein